MKKAYDLAVSALQTQLLRTPTSQEISQKMDISEAELEEWERAFQANSHESLDSVYDQYSIWYASEDDTPEQMLGNTELKAVLRQALDTLDGKEALVIQLYYVEELNVLEVAEVMEVSPGRVSQIKKSAVEKLRDFIKSAQAL